MISPVAGSDRDEPMDRPDARLRTLELLAQPEPVAA